MFNSIPRFVRYFANGPDRFIRGEQVPQSFEAPQVFGACGVRTRQAVWLVSLFIVGATRHLLETRLCPLCPHSAPQRENVNAFLLSLFFFSKGGSVCEDSEGGGVLQQDGCPLPSPSPSSD